MYLFNKMVGIAILSKGNFQLKKVFRIEELKVELEGNNIILSTNNSLTNNPATPRLASPNTTDNTMKLRLENPKFNNDFIEKVKSLKEKHDKKKVFGVNLNTLLENEENPIGVPFIIQNLCNFMLETSIFFYLLYY